MIKKAFIHRFQNHGSDRRHNKSGECLLFGQPDRNIDLSASYPGQAQIFRLWQIYLDNVNPLLKVTHIPTLQPRILDAVSNPESVNPSLQALMFSIYCLSVSSLTQDECFTHFQLSRIDLLAIYQPACRQALLNCSAWRSSEVDSLTALYFYLVSSTMQSIGHVSVLIAFFSSRSRLGQIHDLYQVCLQFSSAQRNVLAYISNLQILNTPHSRLK